MAYSSHSSSVGLDVRMDDWLQVQTCSDYSLTPLMNNDYESIIDAFGCKMGTFTGYWSVRLHPDYVDQKFLSELATQLEASPDELVDAWFCMRKLEVSRSSSRMTVTLDRQYTGPNPFESDLTPEERAEADESMRLKELKATYLNPVKFYFPKEQRYFISPY